MALKKVTKGNHLPETGDGRFRVYSAQFNELIDDLVTGGTTNISVVDATVSGDLTVAGTTTLNGTLVLGDAAADALTVNATTTYAEPVNFSNATGITAFAGGGQASATALTEEVNNVTTVATAGDSVKLPAAVAGKHVYVKNSGATALDIFPASADSIDALAVNLAVRIQPGASINFYAKDAIVWESDKDESLTLSAPSTVKGQLEIKAADSAGNTVTTITNASQAAARTYTVPDAGASASFVMSEGAQTVNGAKTFGSALAAPAGSAAAPAYAFTGQTDMGVYKKSATELGIATAGTFRGQFVATGLELAAGNTVSAAGVKAYEPGTVNTGVTAVHYGDGRNFTSIFTVSQVDAITVADNAALAVGYKLYDFPAGPIVVNSAYMSMAVTLAEDTTATADVGLGTLIGSGANATLNLVGADAENILTGQTAADCNGTPTVKTIGSQVWAIEAAGSHSLYFNVADTWADTAGADLTGDIAGTVTINWTKMS